MPHQQTRGMCQVVKLKGFEIINQYQPERFDEWIACEEYKGYFYKENYEGKKKDMGGENGVYNYLGYEEDGDDEEEWGEKILLTF